MYVSRYTLVVPHTVDVSEHALAATAGEHGKLQAYQGTQAVKNYGITVQGSGVTASGEISGSLTTYDFSAIYQVYQLDTSESAQYWFVNYSKDTSQDVLKETNENSKTLTTNYDVKFTIQGNDYGIQSVFITFEVIRLAVDGVTKDYVVTNPASAGANNSDGSKYNGAFTAEPGGAA